MTIIDVRSKDEYEQEHINGALLFDVERMAAGEMPDLPKDTEIVLYCRSGARADAAMYIMMKQGFSSVTSGGGLGQMVARGHKLAA